MPTDNHKFSLDLAAFFALRAQGYVEPNPLVGAVIVKDGQIIGRGHHRRFGGLHAETEALADCRARGVDPRGSTIYVTLEPCNHFGKQPPCSRAIIEAGIARVVIARADPNPVSTGGAAALQSAGIRVEWTDASPLAIRISDPFVKRITTGLPWVIAKWAQTADGRLVTRPDEPRWISNAYSRRRVHRLRARVDAVVTGIGTVEADDPKLTPRGVARIRRFPRRVVLDTALRLSPGSALLRSASEGPVTVFCGEAAATGPSASALRAAGAEVVGIARSGDHLDLGVALRFLAEHLGTSTVLLEAGPRLLRASLDQSLADELLVYIGGAAPSQGAAAFPGFELSRSRFLGGDMEFQYRRVER